jgi:hypothetical protein
MKDKDYLQLALQLSMVATGMVGKHMMMMETKFLMTKECVMSV